MRRQTIAALVALGLALPANGCSFLRDFDDFEAGGMCAPGMTDCDPSVEGCETNLDTSRDHCGACGRTCDVTDFCAAGSCQQYQAQLAATGSFEGVLYPPRVAPALDGGVFVALSHTTPLRLSGLTDPIAPSSRDIAVARYQNDGALNWVVAANGASVETVFSVASVPDPADPNDELIAMGGQFRSEPMTLTSATGDPVEVSPSTAGSSDGILWVLDRAGEHRWHAHFKGENVQSVRQVVADTDGNLFVAGWFAGSELMIDESADLSEGITGGIFIAKFLPNGARAWEKVFDAQLGIFQSMAADRAGGVYLFSASNAEITIDGTPSVGNSTPRLIHLEADEGKVDWFETYSAAEPASEGEPGVAVTPDGRVFIAFHPDDDSSAIGDFLLERGVTVAEVDPDDEGRPLAARQFGGTVEPVDLQADGDGNLVLAGEALEPTLDFGGGEIMRPDPNDTDVVLIGMDADLEYRWARVFGQVSDPDAGTMDTSELLDGLAMDAAGRVYAGGRFEHDFEVDGLPLTYDDVVGEGAAWVLRLDPIAVD